MINYSTRTKKLMYHCFCILAYTPSALYGRDGVLRRSRASGLLYDRFAMMFSFQMYEDQSSSFHQCDRQ